MSDSEGAVSDDTPTEPVTLGDLYDELNDIESTVTDPAVSARLQDLRRSVVAAQVGPFGNVVEGFDRADAGEALVGALVFGIPMFVESGTSEVGAYFATHPFFLVGTVVAAVVVVVNVLYVADIQDVRIKNPWFGVVPRRLVGVLAISFATALVVMTAWGRIDWADPWLALNTTVVAFVPMAVGAALGDILPGS